MLKHDNPYAKCDFCNTEFRTQPACEQCGTTLDFDVWCAEDGQHFCSSDCVAEHYANESTLFAVCNKCGANDFDTIEEAERCDCGVKK